MNEMQIMNISGVECYERDGTAYILLDNVATGLGITQIKAGITYTRWDRVEQYLSELGFPHKWGKGDFIPENVFYRLAMKAKNPVAEAFQAKVADEIIPSIRKTGGYIMGEEKMSDEELLASAVIMANRKLEERAARIKALEDEKTRLIETNAIQAEQIEEMKPKASYYDIVLATKDLVPITLIAKDYGMSAIEMNRLLHEHGYQYKRNKTWVLYDKYAGNGYTSSKTHVYEDNYGHAHSMMQSQWTQAGRLFIYQELKKFGILPMVERGLIQ